jgi:deoxyribodipyrimidine photo-lyase
MKNGIAIVIFCDDFRIRDNPALHNAICNYNTIIPIYIYNENYLGRAIGAACKVFLHNVLYAFNNLLMQEYKVNLVIQQGNTLDVINEILAKIKVDAIYFNRSYTATQIAMEKAITEQFKPLDVQSFTAKLLFNPWQIKPASGGEFYKVFTPFSKECLKNIQSIGDVVPKPMAIKTVTNIESLQLADLNLLPANEGQWHESLLTNWNFSYNKIEDNFVEFIQNKLNDYKDDRNIPHSNGNARISPYLRFGMLSVRGCFNALTSIIPDIDHQFILELLWREFAYHVMFYNQNIATSELKSEYKAFKWEDPVLLEKWQQGTTGFDIVDAGMQELRQTGIMHNRVRMISASFLTKDLQIDWRMGEQLFWNLLVDADPAINPFSWQWVFGSGFDAAPYFRIFNPDSQRERFDPSGLYCKQWLPKNWQSHRIVSHDIMRNIALQKYKNLQCKS